MKFNYKKSLGQNFLKEDSVIDKIISSINTTENDLIIEIGPGAGALTKKLVNKKSDLICFEIDERLKDKLNNIKADNYKVIFKDFLSININDYITKKYNKLFFIGNLPYYITTAIINKITKECNPYEIVIMIQKEVANRYMAKPSTKEYGSISVFLQYNYDITKVCDVSKNCFEPIPKVDSMVIKLKNKNNNKVINLELFYKLIKDAFRYKRKNLKNNLYEYDLEKIDKVLCLRNKSLKNRAEQLSIDDFIFLANRL